MSCVLARSSSIVCSSDGGVVVVTCGGRYAGFPELEASNTLARVLSIEEVWCGGDL